MKITCPACSASYRIPDEKVQGKNKVFKIGCKRCGAEIRVRGIATEEDLGRTTLPFQMELPDTAATTPQRVWFAGIDGKQVGPLTEGEVIEHIGAGRLKADDLVWRKGFGAWTPVREVAPFQDRLADESKQQDAEPAKRKSPRRAQTLELSAAMIELLVKLDAQGGKSEAEAAGEPPQFPGDDSAGAPPALQAAVPAAAAAAIPEIPDSGEDFAPVLADDDEPPAVPAAEQPPVVPAAAAAAAAAPAAAAATVAPAAATEQPPAVLSAADTGKGRRSPTKVTLPGRAEAQANPGDDAATKVEAMPVADARAGSAKPADTKAAPAAAAGVKPGAKVETKAADPKAGAAKAPAAKAATTAKPSGPAGAPAAKKKDEGGLGMGLIIGLVVVAAAVGGGALYMSKQGKANSQVKANANPVAIAPTPAAQVEPPAAKPEPAAAPVAPAAAVAAAEPAPAAAEPAGAAPANVDPSAAAAAVAGDAAKAEPAKAEGGAAEPGKTDTGKTDTGKTDTGKTDTGKTDTGKADTGKQVGKSDAGEKTTKADTAKADTAKAGTGKGDPMDAIDVIIAKQKAAKEAADKAAADKAAAAAKPPETPKTDTKAAANAPDDLDKLLAAQKAKKEAAKMTAKPEPIDEPSGGGGGGAKLSQGDVDKIAVGARSDVLRCYMTHADIDGGAETIRVDLYVASAGNVTNVKIKGKHGSGEIGNCITGAVKKLHFPQASGATQKYTVRYAVGG